MQIVHTSNSSAFHKMFGIIDFRDVQEWVQSIFALDRYGSVYLVSHWIQTTKAWKIWNSYEKFLLSHVMDSKKYNSHHTEWLLIWIGPIISKTGLWGFCNTKNFIIFTLSDVQFLRKYNEICYFTFITLYICSFWNH